MSISERSPSTSPFGEVTPYDPTQVAGYDRLVARLSEHSVDNSGEVLPVDSDASDESSPIFEQLMAERAGVAETAPAESSVEASSSRLATLLRKGAEAADSSAERWDDAKDRAKKKLRLFGRVALRATTASSEFALGAGMLAANKGLELADRADAAVFTALDTAKEGAKNTYNTAADKTGDAIMNGFAAVETGMDKVGDKMIGLKDGVKERLIARKQAALDRRQARRERWSNRFNSAKDTVNAGLDRSAELAMAAGAKIENGMDVVGTKLVNGQEAISTKAERAKTSVHTTRAAGRAALEAFKATQRVHGEQNQL